MLEIIRFIQSFSSPFLDDFFILITMMGEDIFFILILTLFFWCINKKVGYRLGFAYLTNGLINTYIKDITKVPRPIGQAGIRSLRLETAPGYSFPSGHTQSAASIWTSLMLHYKKKWLYIVGAIMILLVGFSRMYLGLHTLLDVAVGMLIGITWVFTANRIMKYVDESGRKSILFLFIIPAVIGLFVYKTSTFYKASGVLISYMIGYMIETKYINYKVDSKLWQHVVKYLFGLVILLLLKTYLKVLLPELLISDLIRYFILGIWVTVIAPIIFKAVFKENRS